MQENIALDNAERIAIVVGIDMRWRLKMVQTEGLSLVNSDIYARMEALVRQMDNEFAIGTPGPVGPIPYSKGLCYTSQANYDEARAIVQMLPKVKGKDEQLAEIMFDAAYPPENGKRNMAWGVPVFRQGWITAAKAARKTLL